MLEGQNTCRDDMNHIANTTVWVDGLALYKVLKEKEIGLQRSDDSVSLDIDLLPMFVTDEAFLHKKFLCHMPSPRNDVFIDRVIIAMQEEIQCEFMKYLPTNAQRTVANAVATLQKVARRDELTKTAFTSSTLMKAIGDRMQYFMREPLLASGAAASTDAVGGVVFGEQALAIKMARMEQSMSAGDPVPPEMIVFVGQYFPFIAIPDNRLRAKAICDYVNSSHNYDIGAPATGKDAAVPTFHVDPDAASSVPDPIVPAPSKKRARQAAKTAATAKPKATKLLSAAAKKLMLD